MSAVTFSPATLGEWRDAFMLAREYLSAAKALIGDGRELCLVKGTRIYELYQMLTPRALALVELGKLAGEPLASFTIVNPADPKCFFCQTPATWSRVNKSGVARYCWSCREDLKDLTAKGLCKAAWNEAEWKEDAP